MIKLKTPEEIKIMAEGGKRLINVVDQLVPEIKEGTKTEYIDKLAEDLILKQGGTPSFKKVPGFFWSICIPINEQVVHTPPSGRVIKTGDMVTLDIGMYYQGYHTDYAITVLVGEKDPKKEKFLEIGKQTLEKAIQKAQAGHFLGEISEVIQKEIYGNGYFILKELTGHGVGKDLHEEPYVLGFVDRPVEKTYKIKPGLVIAIEIIYSMGTEKIAYEKGDDWSIITRDKSLSACFERSVAITDKNTVILT